VTFKEKQKWLQNASEQVKLGAFINRASKKLKGRTALEHTVWQTLVHLVH